MEHQDGTITRLRVDARTSPSSDPNPPIFVLTEYIVITQPFHTCIRIFLPRKALDSCSSSGNNKLPLILYFHGGGFILFSAASSIFHDFCTNMATILLQNTGCRRLTTMLCKCCTGSKPITMMIGSDNALIIRLVTRWVAGLRAAAEAEHLQPLKIRGLILVQPFLGGSKRCGSELRVVNDSVLPPCVSDLMWELSLPIRVDRDHEYCNPKVGREGGKMMGIREVGWSVLVSGCDGDPLVDRQRELVKWMEEKGVEVKSSFYAGYNHGVEVRDSLKQKQLLGMIKSFVGSILLA